MKTLLKITLTIFISSIFSCSLQESYPKGDITLMFYLGDDWKPKPLNLGPVTWQGSDLDELTRKQVDISTKRVVILYDGPGDGDSELLVLDSPFERAYRKVSLSNTNIKTIKNNELNMGDPETLDSFIQYVKEKLEADSYSLYFGAHGTGYGTDSGSDSINHTSSLQVESDFSGNFNLLEISEIATSLESNNGVDLLVFDACNMGNIENIYELRNSTDFVIASPVTIYGPGNDYRALINNLYSSSVENIEDLTRATLESYYNYYAKDNSRTEHDVIYNKDLLQLYNVKEIVKTLESDNFINTLITHVDNTKNSAFTFNSGNYLRIELTEIDSSITTAEDGEYKLISIYKPEGSINTNYLESEFAKNFTQWTDYLK